MAELAAEWDRRLATIKRLAEAAHAESKQRNSLDDGVVYHTYSAYSRGLDALWTMWQWLDRAPLGRNEGDMSWFHRHDQYTR
jgi:predicted dithiol-disulfide oxidoreductase (DUF899 family)